MLSVDTVLCAELVEKVRGVFASLVVTKDPDGLVKTFLIEF
jgi:hypothetical protein